MAPDTKTSVVKARPGNQDPSSKGKVGVSVMKKKIETSSTRQIPDSKHSVTKFEKKIETSSTRQIADSKHPGTKFEVKSKTVTSSSSKTMVKTTTTKVKGKKEKKVYTLAGQKFDPPEEREPLRIFYESLSKQIPSSEMAEFWMMEHGLLSPERSRKAHEKKQRKLKQIRSGTPIKPSKTPSYKPESSHRQQAASRNSDVKVKKRILDSDDEDEFILSPKRRNA